ncbi:hypothetical protein B0H16DRAFT_678375 [Mycena metata]|uniref:Uncharacterized protein n=1 Tax=Mycena metata TaxID=1033252 RepID=A0AAD7NF20_9AGAR|nr:hypothetical protein B0H16DRAFT_678375 [Mycena metata]
MAIPFSPMPLSFLLVCWPRNTATTLTSFLDGLTRRLGPRPEALLSSAAITTSWFPHSSSTMANHGCSEREAQSCAQVLLAPEVSPPSPASKPVEFVADAGTAYPPTVLDVFNELKDDEAPGCEVDGETGGEAPGFQFDYKSDAATSVVFSNSGVEALPILGDLAVLSPLNTLVGVVTPTLIS